MRVAERVGGVGQHPGAGDGQDAERDEQLADVGWEAARLAEDDGGREQRDGAGHDHQDADRAAARIVGAGVPVRLGGAGAQDDHPGEGRHDQRGDVPGGERAHGRPEPGGDQERGGDPRARAAVTSRACAWGGT